MSKELKQILSREALLQKVKRIAFEVLENNLDEQEIILVGVYDKGYYLAGLIQVELQLICDKPIKLIELTINKNDPTSEVIKIDSKGSDLFNKALILVDDVLNSGKTTSYALSFLLQFQAKKIEIAALVNRSHKAFPIMPTYKGYEIATMIHEFIEVKVTRDLGVYLHS